MKLLNSMEWENDCGISFYDIFPLLDSIEETFNGKHYGDAVEIIYMLLI
jgi:hypothetical protein